MGERRRSREIALQVLFQAEFEPKLNAGQALELFLNHFEADPEIKAYATQLVEGVWSNKDELDRIIQAHTQNWKLNRLAFVDKNILRIATFELRFLRDAVPSTVVLNEAIEIAKRFGSTDSSAFVNGILDNILKGAT